MKKILSMLLSICMIMSFAAQIGAVAEAPPPTISVAQSLWGTVGTTVDVPITIKNNPGILGATIQFEYDSGLTLIDSVEGEAFSALSIVKPGAYNSPCRFHWNSVDIAPEDVKDGTILTLRFKINDTAENGREYRIKASVTDPEADIIDRDFDSVDVSFIDGTVKVIDYVPGDLSGDGKVNTRDAILVSQYIVGGYDIKVNVSAADVNEDYKINTKDSILIRRYIVGGYGVTLYPAPIVETECKHSLTHVEQKNPTATEDGNIEYWYCSKCGKYFSDENAKTEISKDDTVLPATGYTITYNLNTTGNKYLQSIESKINNPNKTTYKPGESFALTDLAVEEYSFDGWYTAAVGGQRVFSIDSSMSGNKTFYAHWTPRTYSIQYECDMVPQASDTYTVGIDKSLPKPQLDKYTFVGWSDNNGKIWDNIPAGTTGEITLKANWASNRNMAVPVDKLTDPAIMEDSQNGLIYFSYKIGKIINVPLYQMSEFLTAGGVETEITTTRSTSQKVQTSQEIAKTLSEATTNSTSWSLSKNWNSATEVSEAYIEEKGITREEAETLAKNSSGSYTVGYASGGTSGTTSSSNSSYAISSNQANHREFEHQNDDSVVTTVDHKFNAEVGASFPISVVNVNAKVGYGYNNNKVTSKSSSDRYAGTDDWSNSENYNSSQSNTSSSSKTWNSTSNSTSSWGEEKTNSVRNAISEMVTREYNTTNSYSLGGSEGETIGKSTVTGEENKLSSTVLYDTTDITTEAVTYRTTGNTHGGYRIVLAGTLQVYAVVIYDISTGEYSVQTYSVLGDGSENDAPKPYLDYCWYNNQFNDYETSVLPFEIPYEVNGYVNSLVARTDGLKYDDDTENVAGFNNKSDTEIVYIPTYKSVDNNDGTYSFTRITTLSKDLFKNNTTIKAVRIGNGVTEIPEGAFEGCTNLKDVYAPSVTKIGDRAFAGCESLNSFTVSEDITEIGADAFEGVSKINVVASSAGVAQAAAAAGANNLVIDISKIPQPKEDEINDENADETIGLNFDIGDIDSFTLYGGDREYKGLSVSSKATATELNGITFSDNTGIPIQVESEQLTLNRVTVNDSSGFAMVLKGEDTKLILNRTNNMFSKSANAILGKYVTIEELSSDVVGKLNITGNMLVYEPLIGDDLKSFTEGTDGQVIYIAEDEYNNYLTSKKVTLDANGGTFAEGAQTVELSYALNAAYGELTSPKRDYCTFDGWYDEPDEGNKIAETDCVTGDITLYAHWIENGPSEWVLASDVPDGAEVVDTRWKYTLTSYTESNSTSMSGWERYDAYWTQSGSGSFNYANFSGYNMNGNYSDWRSDRYYNYENETEKRETNAWHSGYIYMHWCRGRVIAGGPYSSYIESNPGSGTDGYWYGCFHMFESGEDHTQADGMNGRSFKVWRSDICTDSYWWYKIPYYTCSYTDYRRTFKYRKTEEKEATTYPEGDNISNIEEWVQYRVK